MNRVSFVLLSIFVLSSGMAKASGGIRKQVNAIPNQYIVVFKNEVVGQPGSGSRAAEFARVLAARYQGTITQTFQHAINGFSVRMSFVKATELETDPVVDFVEEDSVVTAYTDEDAQALWNLDRIDQRDLPLNQTYSYTNSGLGVNAYILDTGIRPTHQEFSGRASAAHDTVNDGQNGLDCNGHGTHVAGTIGGTTYGVAKSVKLIGVRVLNCQGSGSMSGVVSGVDWVTANAVHPAVANMSLGGGPSSALDQAVKKSIESGVVYAIAAGNSSKDACSASPARVPTALTVGATTKEDARSSFSNFGTCVDVFAPGSSVLSSYMTHDTATATLSGTSMASPHVAGTVALYLETHPAATPSDVEVALKAGATDGRLKDIKGGSPNLLLHTLF